MKLTKNQRGLSLKNLIIFSRIKQVNKDWIIYLIILVVFMIMYGVLASIDEIKLMV